MQGSTSGAHSSTRQIITIAGATLVAPVREETQSMAQSTQGKVQVGDVAPDFTLPDQSGTQISLKDFLGKNIVMYFYPKDNTPGWSGRVKSGATSPT